MKESQLKKFDTIVFYSCKHINKAQVTKIFRMIDINKVDCHDNSIQMFGHHVGQQIDSMFESSYRVVNKDENEALGREPKAIKLFGVQLFSGRHSSSGSGSIFSFELCYNSLYLFSFCFQAMTVTSLSIRSYTL